MKIAVLSDIHGNLTALEAVLADIEKQECEKIFVLGDYAMAGPQPSEAVNWFMKKQFDRNTVLIQGNTDFMIANYNEELYETLKSKAPIMAEALKDDAKLINVVQKDFLKNLPIQLQVDVEGVKILLVHGSPRKNNEDILPETPMSEIEKMLENVDASLVLCGHTHIPCGFQTPSRKTIVNVGSVGRPFTADAKACYLKLTIENGECLFEHRLLNYKREIASELLQKRNFKGADKLAEMLINPTVRHF